MPSFATTLAKAVYAGLGTYPLEEIDNFSQRLSAEFAPLYLNKPLAFVPDEDDQQDEDVEPIDNLRYGPSFEKVLLARVARLPAPPKDL